MNRPIVPLIVAALLALPMAAAAQQSAPARQTAATADASQAKADDQQRIDPNCPQQTGTRIAPRKDKQGRCVLGPGRVYTSDDIARTGETNVADALRKLDPSIY